MAATLAAISKRPEEGESSTRRSPSSVWQVVVYGEDLNTLRGVVRRIADDLRRLPAVRRATVTAAGDEIRHVNGLRAASIDVTANPSGSALGSALQRTIDATVAPAGHRVEIVEAVADVTRLSVAVRTFAFSGAIALLLLAALRHGNWAAPLAIGAGMPLILLGTVPASLIAPEQPAPWIWLGASLPTLMLARQAGALFAIAEERHRDGSSLYVALIDSARMALRSLLLVSLSQVIVLVPFAWLGDAHVAASAFAAIGGLGMAVVAVAFVSPVAYEVAHLALARWRASLLRRRLRQRGRLLTTRRATAGAGAHPTEP